MTEPSVPILKDLTFLYIAAGHLTDGELVESELRVIAEKLRRWQPSHTRDRIGAILVSTMKEYKGLGTNEARHEEVRVRLHRIKQSLSPDKQAHVISDLVAISAADGRVKEGEERFIAITAQVFGFE